MKAPQKILLIGFMLFGKASNEQRKYYYSPVRKNTNNILLSSPKSGYIADEESPDSAARNDSGEHMNIPTDSKFESSKNKNYDPDDNDTVRFASVLSGLGDFKEDFGNSMVNFGSVQNNGNKSVLRSPTMEAIRESPEFYEDVFVQSISDGEMNDLLKYKQQLQIQEDQRNFSDNSLFHYQRNSDEESTDEINDIEDENNFSATPEAQKHFSFLEPHETHENKEVIQKFEESQQHLISFFNSLETAYAGSNGKLKIKDHFILEAPMKPLKFKIESDTEIFSYRQFVKEIGIQFYIKEYTDSNYGGKYCNFMNASKDEIVQNPTFLRLLVAIVGLKKISKMQDFNTGEYTVNLINPFPLTTQAKSLIFGPPKQPNVRIFYQDLQGLTALELTSQQKEIFNSTINDITDTNIILQGKELTVQSFMLFNQTADNWENFMNLCVQNKFRIKNKGRDNIIQKNLQKAITSIKAKKNQK